MMKVQVGDWFIFNASNGGYIIDHVTMVDRERDIIWLSRYCVGIYDEDPDSVDYSANIGGREDKDVYEEILDKFYERISAKDAREKFLAEPIPEDIRTHFLMEELLEIK